MASTYEPIATTTLVSAASSITFSSIPQDYTDLIIVANLRLDSAVTTEDCDIRFNSDTGTNYSYTRVYGTGSATGSQRNSNAQQIRSLLCTGASSPSGSFAVNTVHVMNYSNATTYKTLISRPSNASDIVTANVGLWRSTGAITSVTLLRASGGSFVTGSSATLYGVKAA